MGDVLQFRDYMTTDERMQRWRRNVDRAVSEQLPLMTFARSGEPQIQDHCFTPDDCA